MVCGVETLESTAGGAGGRISRALLAARFKPLPPVVRALVLDSGKYDPDDVEIKALWNALVEAYDDEALAVEACRRQRTIMSPRYTWPPPLIARSKAALAEALGSDEAALKVMCQNPAILQCGQTLVDQPPAQIRGFARFREAVDRVPATSSRALLLLAAVAALCAVPSSTGAERDPALVATLSVVRPVLGTTGAGLFLATIFFSAKAGMKPSSLKGRSEDVTLPWQQPKTPD